jgi:ADP-heptose:LPS heptosyltransferase
MDEKIITPDGIRQARETAKRSNTRLIEFPDGITRHITLPGWQWAALDRFEREDVLFSSEKIIAFAFEAAQADKRYPDEPFEETIRHHLSVGLTASVPWSSAYLRRRTNDF